MTSGDHLRQRAQALRAMARRLERCGLDGVHLRAGHDTWIGPTAVAFAAALDAWRTRISLAIDDLRGHAAHLERLAETADLTGTVVGSAGRVTADGR